MKNPFAIFGIILIPIILVACIIFVAHFGSFPLLFPHGAIATQERNILVLAVFLMLCLAFPVVGAAFFMVWKYRDTGHAAYTPASTGKTYFKLLWWALPGSFVVIFAGIIWYGAHALDPYKPITAKNAPITIEVVALRWKWLFIYPTYNIATVNYLALPVNTPIHFYLTADAPMNSFWIPSLGGQIYAMTAMETQLNLIANAIGDYPGGAAEINGAGFSGMKFMTHVSTQNDFAAWIQSVKKSTNVLSEATYNTLTQPSENTPVILYAAVDKRLYTNIIKKYMEPNSVHEH